MSDPYRFSFEPLFLVLVAVVAALYARALRRADPADRPGAGRIALFALGLLLVAVPLNSPLETISAHHLLLIHLLQNALIADWAPPLLILGLSPELRRGIARAGGKALERATHPVVAIVFWLGTWYGVHVPAFYDWALRDGWPLNLEHLLLFAAGLVFWWPVLGEPRRVTSLAALAYLGIAFMTSPWLSLAYIFASTPFYSFYEHAPRLWGISPLRDQNLAGILMNLEQTSIFFIAFAWQLFRVLAEEEAAQRQLDAAYLDTDPQ